MGKNYGKKEGGMKCKRSIEGKKERRRRYKKVRGKEISKEQWKEGREKGGKGRIKEGR